MPAAKPKRPEPMTAAANSAPHNGNVEIGRVAVAESNRASNVANIKFTAAPAASGIRMSCNAAKIRTSETRIGTMLRNG